MSVEANNSKLIIIRGNSGSGKTTLATALQRHYGRNTMLISQDKIRREMLWVKDIKNNAAIPLLVDLIKYGRENSKVTILEGILYSDIYTRLFQTVVEEYQKNVHAFYFELSFNETLKRHKLKQTKDFGEDEMKQWWREKDYVNSLQENTLTSNLSISDAVSYIVSKVESERREPKSAI
jgi:predicted kinase